MKVHCPLYTQLCVKLSKALDFANVLTLLPYNDPVLKQARLACSNLAWITSSSDPSFSEFCSIFCELCCLVEDDLCDIAIGYSFALNQFTHGFPSAL